MFFKLAFGNVKRSLKDYTIYFLTLAFGVCLFYVFNSIESQQIMLDLHTEQAEILQEMAKLIGAFSLFIAVILAFLILYANKFLIKRRKREIGIYMILGMGKGKVSRIFICETFFIGLFALCVGILVGIFASQGLSVLTANLFSVSLSQFQFTYSTDAIIQCLFYFGVIFLIVMVCNVVTIGKCKLIDLLQSNRKSEYFRVRKTWISIVAFLLSIAMLITAYALIRENKLMSDDMSLYASIILGAVGTLLFFFSLSGFFLKAVQSNKRIYYKSLNMFTFRQISSKCNTTFISMTFVCLMLFISFCTLSAGLGLANALSNDVEFSTPFDATLTSLSIPGDQIVQEIKDDGVPLDSVAKQYDSITLYQLEGVNNSSIYRNIDDMFDSDIADEINDQQLPIMTLSDYNRAMQMQGNNEISLAPNEFAIISNLETVYSPIEDFIATGDPIQIGDIYLYPSENALYKVSVYDETMPMNSGILIIPDKALPTDALAVYYALNINYYESNDAYENQFNSMLEPYKNLSYTDPGRPFLTYTTRISSFYQSAGSKAMISYLALYIGIVFLITCAAILALQQLSEASDNARRYNLLKKLGAESKQIHYALFWQIAIYFFLPLFLALIHSAIGISVIYEIIKIYGSASMINSIIMTAGILVVLFGGYFVATYYSARNVIKNK